MVITLDDGTVKYVDLSALITEYEFADTTTIHFSVANDGTISANVIDGSITEDKLQPNFLADCRSAKTGAETAEADAIAKALVSEGWAVGRQNGTLVGSDSPYYHNNAQYYKDQAQQIAAQSIGGLSDVDIDLQTLENKQILQFNESTGNWENTPLTNDLNYEGVGNPIEFNAPKGGVATKAEVKFSPIQDLHGYTSPWVGGAGKNKIPYTVEGLKAANTPATGWSENTFTVSGMSYTIQTDNGGNVTGILVDGTTSAYPVFNSPEFTLPLGDYVMNVGSIRARLFKNGTQIADRTPSNPTYEFTVDNEEDVYSYRIFTGASTIDEVVTQPIIRLSTASSSYEPYSNICPITGYTELNIFQSNGSTTTPDETYTESLGSTYYGGKIDFATGKLTVDRTIVDLGSLTWSVQANVDGGFICSAISDAKNGEVGVIGCICSNYKGIVTKSPVSTMFANVDGAIGFVGGNKRIVVKDTTKSSYTTDQFKVAMSGVMAVYPLATPIEISVTPETIDLLIGKNVLWTDGDMIFFNASLMIDSNRVTYEDITVEEALDSVTKFRTFNVATTDWVANTGSTSSDYPYIAEITSTYYNADSTPIWQMNGVGTIPTSAERSGINLVQEAVFGASGITLYAVSAPSVALVLEVKGE